MNQSFFLAPSFDLASDDALESIAAHTESDAGRTAFQAEVVAEMHGAVRTTLLPGLERLRAAEKKAPSAELLQMITDLSKLASAVADIPLPSSQRQARPLSSFHDLAGKGFFGRDWSTTKTGTCALASFKVAQLVTVQSIMSLAELDLAVKTCSSSQ